MPVYEYTCPEHGPFEAHRSMGDFAAAGACPACGGASPRILSPPRVRCMAAPDRIARDRNERSQHEPRVVTADDSRIAHASPLRSTDASGEGPPWALGHG
jgi:putative FmdB family regulatory protein